MMKYVIYKEVGGVKEYFNGYKFIGGIQMAQVWSSIQILLYDDKDEADSIITDLSDPDIKLGVFMGVVEFREDLLI